MDADTEDIATNRLKSAVTKRKGRGFSRIETDTPSGFKGIGTFDTLETIDSGHVQRSVEGWVIFVTNLHEETSEEELHDVFAEYGPIKDLRMPLDHRTGYVKGYALIEYTELSSAKEAISKMNESILLDSVIRCNFAFVKTKLKASSRHHQ